MIRTSSILVFVSLVVNPLVLCHTQSNADQWKKIKEEIGMQKNETIINKRKIIRDFEDAFYKVFDANNLTEQQRNVAFALKCKCQAEMEKRINTLFYQSRQDIERDAQKQRVECIARLAQAKTEYLCQEYGLNSAMQEKLGKEEYKKAHDIANSYWNQGKLAYLVDGTLEKELRKKATDLTRKKELYEIYPSERSTRYQQTITNISNGKHYRDTECCVCSESFEDIGKRVNLVCGHDICPSCLYTTKYKYNNNNCPKCRQPITNEDFPADYLQQKMNS